MDQTFLFSVVIVHYNQPRVLYEAIASVLFQNYPRIELIFADDSSSDLDEQEIRRYVEDNKRKNLERFILHRNQTNLGTVKNLNSVLELVQGQYVVFFAADDRLYDESVLSQFALKLQRLPEDGLCVCAQCLMMDEKLQKELGDFTDVNLAAALNKGTSQDQFKVLMKTSFYGLGSSAFRKENFEKYGKFDERYELVEDWSYFLAQTRSKRKVYFSNFYALRHREGGVSHHTSSIEPAYVRVFKEDLLRIRENEILPYLRILPLSEQVKVLEEYQAIREECARVYGTSRGVSRWKIMRQNPVLYLRKTLWCLLSKYAKIIKLSTVMLCMAYFLWIMTGAFGGLFLQTAADLGKMGYAFFLIPLLIRWVFPAVMAGASICLIIEVGLWSLWKLKKIFVAG